jgi:hypothetical protein
LVSVRVGVLVSWSARAMTIPPGGDRDSLSRGLEKLGNDLAHL